MAIRKNTNPQQMDLQPEMRDLLMRNGMQAHVVSNGSGYQLVVQGHDSPLLTYNITEKQMLALTDWGTNHANKLAYNTFTGIVGNDFYMPKNFVHARNANGRVAMGLHGYRVGIGEYGRMGRIDMPPPFLGGHHAVRRDSIFAELEDDCSSPKPRLCLNVGTAE